MTSPFLLIKLFFEAKKDIKEITTEAKVGDITKGWKTTEFWFGLVLPKILLFMTMAQHVLPPTVWAWATTAVAIAYVAGRSGLKIISLIAAARAGDASTALTEVNAQTAIVNK